jgi:hypothetical protein
MQKKLRGDNKQNLRRFARNKLPHRQSISMKKTISCAPRTKQLVAALASIFATSLAHAVHVSPHGTGQVLIYPYYTVRSANGAAYNTLVTVVNTSNQTKALKVRFLEGRRGAQVMDFNLFSSPNDVWAGAVAATADGTRLLTADNSCVLPSDLFTAAAKNEFRNQAYLNDTGPSDLDRTREGHIEVIEMGVITNTVVTGYIRQQNIDIRINCAPLEGIYATGTIITTLPNEFAPPSGGLTGRAVIISPANGAAYGYDATALDAWSETPQFTKAGSEAPLLGAANPPVSLVQTSEGVVNATWASGRDAVTAALMRSAISNEFSVEAATTSETDWVITYPTKREYVDVGTGPARALFFQNFNMISASAGGSCDALEAAVYNRETGTRGSPSTIDILPFAPDKSLLGSKISNNWFDQTRIFIFGATTAAGTATSVSGTIQGPAGWLKASFGKVPPGITPLSATRNGIALQSGRHSGLPLIALAFTNFRNTGVASQYGIVHPSKYTITVAP